MVSMQPHSGFSFDPRNLEIKTKSVEATLLPLVTQISTLVNFKEHIITGNRPKSERALRAALKIGGAVQAAVERFVVVGETIADENPDIQPEMYDACHEARLAGGAIANLHSSIIDDSGQSTIGIDKSQLVKAARRLLSSVTRVLLLADRVLVKHVLRAEDKISYSLTKLENTSNFTEFVKIFTDFGNEMVELAHRSGDRQNDLKSEKRQAQMCVARSCLERMTMLLLTSSKTLLRHPDDQAARQCRDGVFHEIRLSLQLIGVCVTDGIIPFDPGRYGPSPDQQQDLDNGEPLDVGTQMTASIGIRHLTEMLEMVKMMSLIGSGVQERLVSTLDSLCEMTQDFTDSAYTPHHQREQILDFLEECRFEMSNLVNPQPEINEHMRNEVIEVTVERLNRRLNDLKKQLQTVALEQVAAVFRTNDDQTILSSIKTCSMSGDIDGVEKFLEKFREHADHLQDVCRLLHHVSITDALHVYSGHARRNLRSLAPLTLLAGRTLCIHPSSRIARENLEVFCDTWAANVNDLSRLVKDMDAAASNRVAAEKQAYMSLPRPGVSPPFATSSSSPSEFVLCCGDFINNGGYDSTTTISNAGSPHSSYTSANRLDDSCCGGSGGVCGERDIIAISHLLTRKSLMAAKEQSKDSGICSLTDSTRNGHQDKRSPPSPAPSAFAIVQSGYATVHSPSSRSASTATDYSDGGEVQYSVMNKPVKYLEAKVDHASNSAFVDYSTHRQMLKEVLKRNKSDQPASVAGEISRFCKTGTGKPNTVPLRQKPSSAASSCRRADQFENRISVVLEYLQLEADNLQKMIDAPLRNSYRKHC